MANRFVKTHAAQSALNNVGAGPIDVYGGSPVTLMVVFSTGTSAGAVQLEASATNDFAGTWAAVGTPVAWSAANKVEYKSFAESHRFLRARISTGVVGGTCDVYIITAGFSAANW